MKPMHLPDVENGEPPDSSYARLIAAARRAAAEYPQIWHLFAFKPNATRHLEQFTQEVMRGCSPLSAGFRELIAAMVSARNQCPF
ncbi:MAG: peroxidase [Acidobacteria bacterium]|nr:peroxidase [Acidobacteriota bacterium]